MWDFWPSWELFCCVDLMIVGRTPMGKGWGNDDGDIYFWVGVTFYQDEISGDHRKDILLSYLLPFYVLSLNLFFISLSFSSLLFPLTTVENYSQSRHRQTKSKKEHEMKMSKRRPGRKERTFGGAVISCSSSTWQSWPWSVTSTSWRMAFMSVSSVFLCFS